MTQRYSVQDYMRHFEQFGRFPHPIAGGTNPPETLETPETPETPVTPEKPETPKTFTQADVDKIVGDRVKRERTKLKDEILGELKTKADEEAAISRGQFDKVLADRDAEIVRLTGLQTTVDEYDKLAKERQEKAIKDLPDPIKLLMPDDLTPLEFDKWFTTKATPAMAKLGGKKGNNPADPEVTKKDVIETLMENELKKMQQSGSYRL